MNQTFFIVTYWIISLAIVVAVYLFFVFLRKKIVAWGRKLAKNYMDKIDPDLESVDEDETSNNKK